MDTSDLSHHIHSRYNAELEGIRTGVLQMGGLVEQQISRAMEALSAGDMALADQVIADDLRRRIRDAEFDLSGVLPSESRLSSHYAASRVTVRRALEVLRIEGLVVSGRTRAGIRAVIVPNAVTTGQDFSLAAEVLDSLDALALEKYFPL